MTEEAFLEQVSPIPEHDHFYFAKPDTSLGNNVYSRAYINFVNVEDIYLFRDKFDGYIFLDEKGKSTEKEQICFVMLKQILLCIVITYTRLVIDLINSVSVHFITISMNTQIVLFYYLFMSSQYKSTVEFRYRLCEEKVYFLSN